MTGAGDDGPSPTDIPPTDVPAEGVAPSGVTPPPPPVFGAGRAFLCFLMVLAGQCAAGLILGGLVGARLVADGRAVEAPAVRALILESMPLLLALTAVTQTLALLAAIRLFAWDAARDRSQAGLGLGPPAGSALPWAALAAALAAAYCVAALWVVPRPPDLPLGPLAQTAMRGGWARVVWAAVALLVAPVTEELLFRGVLFQGFAASWGRWAAGTIVTVLFVLLHLGETWTYWPSIVSILAVALVALAARVRTGSVWPAVAAHLAHNTVIVVVVFAAAF